MELHKLPGLILPWYEKNKRDLPWRRDREPYHVWLSEIMLQQTRVEAVKGYYDRFLTALPTIESLANAPEDLCHKLWEGLGYYSRVRNLQKGAKQVMERHGGRFPDTYGEIRDLAGIGDYTAGAIASICFDLPTPAVDGNVVRVMTRLTMDNRPANSLPLRRELQEKLREIYPKQGSGEFTQGLMELGATVCLPNGEPLCEKCPVCTICGAYQAGKTMEFPVKATKKPRKVEEKTVFILRCGDRTAILKRKNTGLLAGLWEFPNVPGLLDMEEAIVQAEKWNTNPLSPDKIVEKSHIFTHIEWKMRGIYLTCSRRSEAFTWATEDEFDVIYALPTAFRQFREEKP